MSYKFNKLFKTNLGKRMTMMTLSILKYKSSTSIGFKSLKEQGYLKGKRARNISITNRQNLFLNHKGKILGQSKLLHFNRARGLVSRILQNPFLAQQLLKK